MRWICSARLHSGRNLPFATRARTLISTKGNKQWQRNLFFGPSEALRSLQTKRPIFLLARVIGCKVYTANTFLTHMLQLVVSFPMCAWGLGLHTMVTWDRRNERKKKPLYIDSSTLSLLWCDDCQLLRRMMALTMACSVTWGRAHVYMSSLTRWG